MLYLNFMDNLFGTQGVKYTKSRQEENRLYLGIEMPRRMQKCPCCGKGTERIHDYRTQEIKAGKHNHLQIILEYRKRRYVCDACGKRFAEENPVVGRYRRMSRFLTWEIVQALKETVSMSHIARESQVSTQTVMRILDKVYYPRPQQLPRAIGIDEFRGNANGEKYQVILTDLETGTVLDILPSRKEADLKHYFLQYTREERGNVQFFVNDMWKGYDRIAGDYFSRSTKLIDRFHWVRQVIWALENVRKREQKRFGAARKYFKRSKTLLIKREKELSLEGWQILQNMLSLSSDLYTAHFYKEKILGLMEIEDVKERKQTFSYLIGALKDSGIPELERCADAYWNWQPSILNSLEHPYSNGFTEGCNNKIKALKRTAYGFRNFERFRKRILHMFAA